MLVYKIRRKADGKFSTGSHRPKFNKFGHTWNALQNVFNQIKNNSKYHYDDYFNTTDFEVVEFELKETNTFQIEKINTENIKNEDLD